MRRSSHSEFHVCDGAKMNDSTKCDHASVGKEGNTANRSVEVFVVSESTAAMCHRSVHSILRSMSYVKRKSNVWALGFGLEF